MLDNIKSRLAEVHKSVDNPPPEDERSASESDSSVADSTGDVAATDPTHTARQEPVIALDDVFGLLKNRRRREVLRYLRENTGAVRLGELAEEIAALECEKELSTINSQERKRVYVCLYQSHLPRLADVNAITYNKPRGIIERGRTFDHITNYLPREDVPADQGSPIRSLFATLSNVQSTV